MKIMCIELPDCSFKNDWSISDELWEAVEGSPVLLRQEYHSQNGGQKICLPLRLRSLQSSTSHTGRNPYETGRQAGFRQSGIVRPIIQRHRRDVVSVRSFVGYFRSVHHWERLLQSFICARKSREKPKTRKSVFYWFCWISSKNFSTHGNIDFFDYWLISCW